MAAHPVFGQEVTYGAPLALTAGGALDGIAHSREVAVRGCGRTDAAIAFRASRLRFQHL